MVCLSSPLRWSDAANTSGVVRQAHRESVKQKQKQRTGKRKNKNTQAQKQASWRIETKTHSTHLLSTGQTPSTFLSPKDMLAAA